MISADDVKQTLARCAGYDPAHFPKRSDVILAAWHDHLMQYPQLTAADLAGAVREYYNQPSQAVPQPADISAIARKYSRERYERSELDSPERLRLEETCNAKAAPEAQGGALPPGTNAELPALASGYVVPEGDAESLRKAQGRLAAINAFAAKVGKPVAEVEDRYRAATVQEIRAANPPIPLPCPDCGALEPCEHDKEDEEKA